MDLTQSQQRRRRAAQRRRRARLRGLAALCALVALGVAAMALASSGGGAHHAGSAQQLASTSSRTAAHRGARARRARTGAHGAATGDLTPALSGPPVGPLGTDSVPILMYHVINQPPPGAPFPGLYVPAAQFAAQMQALAAAGWHAVTLDQVWAYWKRGVPLGPGKPIVISFDNGYQSQYNNALPVLQRLHWRAILNLQVSGLPPSQGGLTSAQVRRLIAAGWELDTQGYSHADLPALSGAQLRFQISTARDILRARYHQPVDWFCYPSGQYDASVIAAVRAAGFLGSTTVVPGWASPDGDPYRLPRVRVAAGTTPQQLLGEIAAEQAEPPPPSSYVTN
jgi:peptidoglycan/xylan/chitin deacetylase (PgdA/CDA1 family)